MPDAPDVQRQLGFLEGKVEALDARMTRREAEDAAWRDDVKAALADINRMVSQSVGGLNAIKWAAGLLIPAAIVAIGWFATHVWPLAGAVPVKVN